MPVLYWIDNGKKIFRNRHKSRIFAYFYICDGARLNE